MEDLLYRVNRWLAQGYQLDKILLHPDDMDLALKYWPKGHPSGLPFKFLGVPA